MDAVTKRLACLIALSVVLHATALVPFKVNMTPSRQPFSPLLTVDLAPRDTPSAAPRIPLATAPQEAPAPAVLEPAMTHAPVSDAPSAAPTTEAKPVEALKPDPPAQPAGKPVPPGPEATSNAASQPQGGVRIAVLDEVSVRVHLFSYEGGQKPNDTVLVQGKSYVYFKSPSLRRATQPLDDIKPHYPAQKPLYIHGGVKLQLLIDEEGKLEQAIVMCSNPDFEKSALASVEHLRFTPAQALTGPVKSYMVVEFGYGRGFPCAPVPDLTPSK